MIINPCTKVKSTYKFLIDSLDSKFTLDTAGKSKVIFGYNGIGKTTIFNILKENNEDIEFLSYTSENGENINIKEQDLIISSNTAQIAKLNEEIATLNKNLDGKNLIKEATHISTQKEIKSSISDKAATFFSKKSISIKEFKKSKDDLEQFLKKHGKIDYTIFPRVYKDALKISNTENEINKYKDSKLYKAISLTNDMLTDKDEICPICDSRKDGIKQLLESKLKKKEKYESELMDKMFDFNVNPTKDELDSYVNIARDLSADEEMLLPFIIAKGDIDKYENLLKMQNELRSKENELSALKLDAEAKYKLVEKSKNKLKNDLIRYFGLTDHDITFKPEMSSIKMHFPRAIETYSTGEINLITFLYGIYCFLGSDKKTLIMDDPASSYDLINHYKIAYEIVKNAKEKNIIVLTHSIDLINIINSQDKTVFDYYYLEHCGGKLLLELIKNDYDNLCPNIITIDRLDRTDGFVDGLEKRDQSNGNDNAFHYSTTEYHINNDNSKISNKDMVKMIDDFVSFTYTDDFFANSLTKIKYIAALRVWIEFKIYGIIKKKKSELISRFENQRTLSQKIDLIMPTDGSNPFNITKFTREDLMCKKVMLNQGIHYKSQIAPFAYAINISFDQLSEEIKDIKKMLTDID